MVATVLMQFGYVCLTEVTSFLRMAFLQVKVSKVSKTAMYETTAKKALWQCRPWPGLRESSTHWKEGARLGRLSPAPRSAGEKECSRPAVAEAPSPPPDWLQPHSQSQHTPGEKKKKQKEINNKQEAKEGLFALRSPFVRQRWCLINLQPDQWVTQN